MNAFKLVFSAKACFKRVVRSVKIKEGKVFLVDPYYYVLPYLLITVTSYILTKQKEMLYMYKITQVTVLCLIYMYNS